MIIINIHTNLWKEINESDYTESEFESIKQFYKNHKDFSILYK